MANVTNGRSVGGSGLALSSELRGRFDEHVAGWRVDVDQVRTTPSAVLALGRRGGQRVVVKVARVRGDEWHAGFVLMAFGGRGTVRVHDAVEGAALLECLDPGDTLADAVLDDEQATRIVAGTIAVLSPAAPAVPLPTVGDWGRSFERYRARGDARVPAELVEAAERVYVRLCETQSRVRLLHGDLHHGNILRDAQRGWVAIDPKGVLGEPEYEVGAALRNPWGRSDVFANPRIIESRVSVLGAMLGFDEERILAWAFAQSVLSVLWDLEDGIEARADHGCLALARAVRGMLGPP